MRSTSRSLSKRGCHLAFLRAIDVRGQASVHAAALVTAFESAGCTDVRTYIQSGNVAFRPPAGQSAAVFASIRVALRRVLGETPIVLFRSARELAALVDANPFEGVQHEPPAKLYVGFLSRRPWSSVETPIEWPEESMTVTGAIGREVFIVSRPKPDGFYAIPNPLIESALGVPATTRSWSMVSKLVELTREEYAQVGD